MSYHEQDNELITLRGRPGGLSQNPGREQAVAALILALLFPILGFILAVFSINRSKNAGWPPERLARIALWVALLLFIAGLLFWFWAGGWNLTFLRNLWWI
jgi:small-conductance mechanosensitive channel